jgi:hypothetical protein
MNFVAPMLVVLGSAAAEVVKPQQTPTQTLNLPPTLTAQARESAWDTTTYGGAYYPSTKSFFLQKKVWSGKKLSKYFHCSNQLFPQYVPTHMY